MELAGTEAADVRPVVLLTVLHAGGRGRTETSLPRERLQMEAAPYEHPQFPNMETHSLDMEHAL